MRNLFRRRFKDATIVVHCAAKVGDWGPVEDYRQINVRGLESLLSAAETNGVLKRFVHISSLGVYPARDHFGTDESTPVSTAGIDGYTLTKVEAELLVREHIQKQKPAGHDSASGVYLRAARPHGPPANFRAAEEEAIRVLGIRRESHEQHLRRKPGGCRVSGRSSGMTASGTIFNITDGRLVSKIEFIKTIAESAGYPVPTKHVPLPVARVLAKVMEGTWKLLGKKEAPLLSNARIKFLGLNLDYSIEKAKRELGYRSPGGFSRRHGGNDGLVSRARAVVKKLRAF